MKSWMPMLAAGLAALIGGLFALINPTGAAVTTVTLVGWALIIVAALQGWAAWKSLTTGARIRSGAIAAIALLLALFLVFGDPAQSRLLRIVITVLLLASGGAKIYAAQAMKGEQNMPLVVGAGVVSLFLGLVLMIGLNPNFGVLLGIELLATGLGLVLLGMFRRTHPAIT